MKDQILVTGMVMSAQPIGEADRRVVLLTQELGRISAFARSARKPTSSLVGCTRPFSTGKFYIYPGRDSYTVVKAEISEYFEGIVTDIAKSAYGCYFLELASYFTREGVEAKDILLLIYLALKGLENPHLPDKLVKTVYELKLLMLEGLLPVPKEQDHLSDSASYAVEFIREAAPGKLFSFLLKEEAYLELKRFSDRLIDKNVDRPLSSREMLAVLT